MNATTTGLLAGLLLGVAGAAGGFVAFIIALVLGAIGLVVGRVLDGELDVSGVLGRGEGQVTVSEVGTDPGSALAEPESRGSLEIDSSVLRKIVEHAAEQAPGTRHRTRTVAGLGVGESRPSAKISAYAEGVDVTLRLALAYPAPIKETVADVRRRISEDLDRIAGQRVRSLTVDVGALQSDRVPDEPRVR